MRVTQINDRRRFRCCFETFRRLACAYVRLDEEGPRHCRSAVQRGREGRIPMSTEWPDQVPAIFMGGILDGRELMVPANNRTPLTTVRLVPGSDPPVVVPAAETSTGVRYLIRMKLRPGDPWRFMLWAR